MRNFHWNVKEAYCANLSQGARSLCQPFEQNTASANTISEEFKAQFRLSKGYRELKKSLFKVYGAKHQSNHL